jgi:hypothetical protein
VGFHDQPDRLTIEQLIDIRHSPNQELRILRRIPTRTEISVRVRCGSCARRTSLARAVSCATKIPARCPPLAGHLPIPTRRDPFLTVLRKRDAGVRRNVGGFPENRD